jgi:molybdenum cofactor biosynthesis enzyme MoaA
MRDLSGVRVALLGGSADDAVARFVRRWKAERLVHVPAEPARRPSGDGSSEVPCEVVDYAKWRAGAARAFDLIVMDESALPAECLPGRVLEVAERLALDGALAYCGSGKDSEADAGVVRAMRECGRTECARNEPGCIVCTNAPDDVALRRRFGGGVSSGEPARSATDEDPKARPPGPPFCDRYWVALYVGLNKIRTCCQSRAAYRLPIDFVMRGTTLRQVFNSDLFREARAKLLAGAAADVCKPACPVYQAWQRGESKPSVEAEDFSRSGYSDLFQRNWDAVHEAVAEGRIDVPLHPIRMNVQLGLACNLRCRMCGWVLRDRPSMDPHVLEQVERELPYVRKLIVTGGEPFLFPWMRRACDLAAEHPHLRLVTNTNGNLIDTSYWCDKIIRHFGGLHISVDAARPETYERIRCGGDFDRVLRVTRRLLARRTRRDQPTLRWNFAIQRDNASEVVDFARLAAEIGVDAVRYQVMVAPRAPKRRVTEADEVYRERTSAVEVLAQLAEARVVLEGADIHMAEKLTPILRARHPEWLDESPCEAGPLGPDTA